MALGWVRRACAWFSHAVLTATHAQSTAVEKRRSKRIVQNYIDKSLDGRISCPVRMVESGAEPPIFTLHFLDWGAEERKVFLDPREARARKYKEVPLRSPPALLWCLFNC